jgi:hypothetical protein
VVTRLKVRFPLDAIVIKSPAPFFLAGIWFLAQEVEHESTRVMDDVRL